MPTLTHDIIISGAGPVGSTLALMLAEKTGRPERIALVGKFPAAGQNRTDTVIVQQGVTEQAGMAANTHIPDPRTLALNQGSRVLLQHLGAWPDAAANIHVVHVSQQGRLGRTRIHRDDLNVPRLGSVVAYSALLAKLHDSLHNSGVDIIDAVDATPQSGPGHVRCTTPNATLSAHVAVLSDGSRPRGVQRHYNQDALIATARASLPQPVVAFERFTRQGPLALLPHPDDAAAYAVVWCCPPDQAQALQALSPSDFNAALNRHFGDRLGTLTSVGERHVFPLSLHAGASLVNPRTVAIGNAAQTLHPVAGQGLNLGLRDVAQLSRSLSGWLADPSSDVTPWLREFTQRRRADRWLTAGITDFLPRIFTTGQPLVEHASGLALLGLDLFPPARNILARHLLQGLRQ